MDDNNLNFALNLHKMENLQTQILHIKKILQKHKKIIYSSAY